MTGTNASRALAIATANIDASKIDASACAATALAALPAVIRESFPAYFEYMVANKKKPGPYLAFYMKILKEGGIEFTLNSVFIANFNVWARERGTQKINVNACRSEPLIDEELSNLIQQSSNHSCLRMHLYEMGSCMYEHSDGRGATAHENIKVTLIRTL